MTRPSGNARNWNSMSGALPDASLRTVVPHPFRELMKNPCSAFQEP
ncbi:hypothetical protein [Streptomyces sp. NPDC005131]